MRPNLILIVCDTLRRDHVSAWDGALVRTPNLERLAAQSVVLDGAYACSFPTLPCRVELLTGKFVFPSVRWGPFPAGETPVAERLRAAGYHTAIIADNLPVMQPGHGYDRGFDTRVHIRGQWYDPWRSEPAVPELPAPEDRLGNLERLRQYQRNVASRRCEEDYFAPQVMTAASDWLRRFAGRSPFFLYVDCFDPHEPWDPPAQYVDPALVGEERIIYPRFGRSDAYTEPEMASIRELYAGEVRLADRWLGMLLDTVAELGLDENTAVLFMSDHGIFLGEHGLLGKSNRLREDVDGWPPYREVSQIPMMVRLPGAAPRRAGGFAHPGDLMPTLMELAGLETPAGVTAASLLPLARGEVASVRDVAVTSWSYRGWRPHHPTCIRDAEWSLVWWRSGIPPRLHHLPDDPAEGLDVSAEHPEEARRLHARLMTFLKDVGCPPQSYWPRRFFFAPAASPPAPEADRPTLAPQR